MEGVNQFHRGPARVPGLSIFHLAVFAR